MLLKWLRAALEMKGVHPSDLYLDLCDWPLWQRWPCWWRSGGSRSRLPPWVKNGRCSAACGEWRHPTLAWSSHTTGNTPTGKRKEEKERRRVVSTESQIRVDMSRKEKKRWMKKARGRERGKTPNSDTDTMTGTKAILLANSNAGWVTGETQRDAVISEIPSSHTNTDEAAASIKTQILLSCLNNDQTSQTHDTELQQ